MGFLQKTEQDFKFIILEVSKQVKDTQKFLSQPEEELFEKISNRDDYIDILKSRIEEHCFTAVLNYKDKNTAKQAVDYARAINIIGANLERIADYSVSIVDQMQYLHERTLLESYDLKARFKEAIQALGLIEKALFKKNINLAMQICQSEYVLDKLYTEFFQKIIAEIRLGKNVENRITLLFILSYLERIGDALLNIGEAIIFAILGQKLKVHQYKAIEETLASSEMNTSIGDVAFESIWGTRSGCRIGHIRELRPTENAQKVIFKKGSRKKLMEEKENIKRWENIFPGLPPRILNFQENGRHSSMLVEYLGSSTFQHIILNATDDIFSEAFLKLQKTLSKIWSLTKQDKVVNAGYSKQISARIQDVLSVHPSFRMPDKQIGSVSVYSFDEHIRTIRSIDKALGAPFSVFIHGDFNSDNIIYNQDTGKIHFIDLHRSQQSDFVQDIAVFLVSNFRLPVFETPLRKRLNTVIKSFYHFTRDFAGRQGDTTFNARLALGIARSLITSTRFELNSKFARAMFMRSIYIFEKLTAHNGAPWESFVLPQDILIY